MPDDTNTVEEESRCDDCDEYVDVCDGDCQDNTHNPYGESTTDDPAAHTLSPLTVESLSNRPARLVSAEIEVGMGGNYLAETFHNVGLSNAPYMQGYHCDDEDKGFVRVEEDCTVAAEVIFEKMDLSRPGDAARFSQGVGIIRSAIDGGACKLDMRCGLHIHVGVNRTDSAPGYTQDNLTSLYHLWNYVEDTVFRLAAANWNGHRSEHGNDYAPKTRKGCASGTESYGRDCLNVSNYVGAVRSHFGHDWKERDWSAVTIEYGCPTIEFRVFNTSANTRKLRGYVALCQALIAYAQEHDVTPEDFPPMEWTENSSPDRDESAERIRFIMSQLPLTIDERSDLAYCIERCSLAEV